jgi:hypothetical protein
MPIESQTARLLTRFRIFLAFSQWFKKISVGAFLKVAWWKEGVCVILNIQQKLNFPVQNRRSGRNVQKNTISEK